MNEDLSYLPATPFVSVKNLQQMNATGLFWPVSGDATTKVAYQREEKYERSV